MSALSIFSHPSGVEMFHQVLDRAEAGDQLGALIRGPKRDDIRRGMILAKPGSINMYNHFQAQVTLITKEHLNLTNDKPLFTSRVKGQMPLPSLHLPLIDNDEGLNIFAWRVAWSN